MNIVQNWKKNLGFRSYVHFEYILFFRVSHEYLNLKFSLELLYLELFPEQIQNSGIFRTRDILRTLSIYPVKI